MLRKLTKLLILLSVCSTLAFVGCRGYSGDATERHEETQALLEQGKGYLSENRWGQARETFTQVVNEHDAMNSHARFGLVLADLLSFTDTIRLLTSLTDAFAPASADENQFVNQLLTDVIHDLRAKFETIDRNLLLAQADPAFHFEIDELPIYLTSSVTPDEDLGGTWDRASLFLVDTIVTAVIGGLNVADSIDLRLDVLRAYDFYSHNDDMDLDGIQAIVTYILNDGNYPNFLSIKPGVGNDLMAEAGLNFAQAIQNWQTALYLASIVPSDDTEGRIVSYLDRAKTGGYSPSLDPLADNCAVLEEEPVGEYDDRDPFVLLPGGMNGGVELRNGPLRVLEHSACLFQTARVNLAWDHVQNPPANVSARDRAQLDAFAGFYTQRPRINLLNHVMPLVASLGASILEDMDLDDELAVIFAVITDEFIMDMIEGILGDSIELDPYAYFSTEWNGRKAGNIRGLLPAWTNDCTQAPDPFQACSDDGDELIFSMDCTVNVDPDAELTDQLVEQFICTSDAAGADEDTGHFDEHEARLSSAFGLAPIPADDIDSLLPYIAFQDASMNGVVYLDLYGLSEATGTDTSVKEALRNVDMSSGFRAADLMDLNTFIAALSRNDLIETGLALALDD